MTAVNKSGLNRYCIAIDIILLFDCVYKSHCKEKQLKIKKGCLKYDIQFKKKNDALGELDTSSINKNKRSACYLGERSLNTT